MKRLVCEKVEGKLYVLRRVRGTEQAEVMNSSCKFTPVLNFAHAFPKMQARALAQFKGRFNGDAIYVDDNGDVSTKE